MLGPLAHRPLSYHHFPQLWILCLCDFSVEKYCLTGGTGGWVPGTCEEKSGKRPSERSVQKKKISTKWTAFPACILACAESRGCWNKWARLIEGNFAHIFLFWLFFCVESCCKRKQKTKNKRIQPKTFSLWNKIFSRDEFIFTTWGCRCVASHTKEIHGVFWIYDFWYTHTTLTLTVLLPATSNSERTNWPSVLINFKWLEFFAIFSQQSFSEGNWKPSFFVC